MPWVVRQPWKHSRAVRPLRLDQMVSKNVAVNQPRMAIRALNRSATTSRPIQLDKLRPLAICVLCMTACYFLQSSVVTFVIPGSYLNLATYVFLCLVSAVLVAVSGLRLVTVWPVLFVACAFVSSLTSNYPSQSVAKCVGLGLVIAVVGPVLRGELAVSIRETAWRSSMTILVAIGTASAVWYLLGLPMLGRGAFSGVMMHSMLVGPISGMASVVCLNRAFYTRSRGWLFLGLLCVFPCLLAASRIAFVALVGAVGCLIFLFSLTASRAGVRMLSTIGMGAATLGIAFAMVPSLAIEQVSQDLLQKSGNSRAELWSARMREFTLSPVLGFGIGVGEGEGFSVIQGKVVFEPGSTYLAVLSMTGLAGAICIAAIFGFAARRVWAAIQKHQNIRLTELAGIGVYLALHGLAEGWLLAVGSPLCLLAWLCFGRAYDLCPAVASAQSPKHRPQFQPVTNRP